MGNRRRAGAWLVAIVAGLAVVLLMPAVGEATTSPSSAPGVTADSIKIGFITSKTGAAASSNQYSDLGCKARVGAENAKGGVNGRKIEVVKDRDDIVGLRNTQEITASLADDNAFATFEATQQLTGADLLAKAGEVGGMDAGSDVELRHGRMRVAA